MYNVQFPLNLLNMMMNQNLIASVATCAAPSRWRLSQNNVRLNYLAVGGRLSTWGILVIRTVVSWLGYVYKRWIDENTLAPTKPGTGFVVAVKTLTQENHQGHGEWLVSVISFHFGVRKISN
jgi:hypothetical protein